MSDYTLSAEAREDVGKGASRRLRREEGKVPAIVYGGEAAPRQITLAHNELIKLLEEEAFYTSLINLEVAGDKETVVLKDLQRHPAKALIIHADFLRVDENRELVVRVPLHFINEDTCIGVKMQGGTIDHSASNVEVRCLPKDLPEYIEVDMAAYEVGTIVHISDLELPEGVSSVALSYGEDHDQPVAIVKTARGGGKADEDEADAGEEAADEAAEGDSEE